MNFLKILDIILITNGFVAFANSINIESVIDNGVHLLGISAAMFKPLSPIPTVFASVCRTTHFLWNLYTGEEDPQPVTFEQINEEFNHYYEQMIDVSIHAIDLHNRIEDKIECAFDKKELADKQIDMSHHLDKIDFLYKTFQQLVNKNVYKFGEEEYIRFANRVLDSYGISIWLESSHKIFVAKNPQGQNIPIILAQKNMVSYLLREMSEF